MAGWQAYLFWKGFGRNGEFKRFSQLRINFCHLICRRHVLQIGCHWARSPFGVHLLGVAVAARTRHLVSVLVVSTWASLRRKNGVNNLPGASKKLHKRWRSLNKNIKFPFWQQQCLCAIKRSVTHLWAFEFYLVLFSLSLRLCWRYVEISCNQLSLVFSLQKIVKEIEGLETGKNDRPKQLVVITDSGLVQGVHWPYEVPKTGVFV